MFRSNANESCHAEHIMRLVYSIKGREVLAGNEIMSSEMTKWRLNVVLWVRLTRECGRNNQRREESNFDCAGTPKKARQQSTITSADSIVDDFASGHSIIGSSPSFLHEFYCENYILLIHQRAQFLLWSTLKSFSRDKIRPCN